MKGVRLAAVFLASALILVACAQPPSETTSTEVLPDGTRIATVAGWGAEFSLEMTSASVVYGDRLPTRITLRNTSDEPLDMDDHMIRVYFDKAEGGPSFGGTGYGDVYGRPKRPLHLRSGETTTVDFWASSDWGDPNAVPPREVFVRASFQGMFTPYVRVEIE